MYILFHVLLDVVKVRGGKIISTSSEPPLDEEAVSSPNICKLHVDIIVNILTVSL